MKSLRSVSYPMRGQIPAQSSCRNLTHPLCERSSWGGGPFAEERMVEGPVRATRKSMQNARRQRRAMSPPEVKLWALLRRSPDGIRFRRQHPIGPYVADFYCPAAKLVIEVDGLMHDFAERAALDEARNTYMRGRGLEVIRIPAAAVFRDATVVAQNLISLCADRRGPSTVQLR